MQVDLGRCHGHHVSRGNMVSSTLRMSQVIMCEERIFVGCIYGGGVLGDCVYDPSWDNIAGA